MPALLPSIPPDAMRLSFLETGEGRWIGEDWVHQKTVPFTIVAQSLVGQYEVTCAGGTAHTEANEAFLAPPHEPLRIVHHGDSNRGRLMKARWIHFTVTLFDTVDFSTLLEMPLKTDTRRGRELGIIIGKLIRGGSHGFGSLSWSAYRQELVWRVLRILCEISQPREEAWNLLRKSDRLLPVLAYLRRNLRRTISVEQMAQMANLSPSAFHARFKNYFAQTPANYLKHLRLTEAAYELSTTDLSLAQIADGVGFQNPFHFSREFKRQFRLAPSEYRRTLLHGSDLELIQAV